MTISHYKCFRCRTEVTEEHEGPRVRRGQRVICKACCRKSVDAAFGVQADAPAIQLGLDAYESFRRGVRAARRPALHAPKEINRKAAILDVHAKADSP